MNGFEAGSPYEIIQTRLRFKHMCLAISYLISRVNFLPEMLFLLFTETTQVGE